VTVIFEKFHGMSLYPIFQKGYCQWCGCKLPYGLTFCPPRDSVYRGDYRYESSCAHMFLRWWRSKSKIVRAVYVRDGFTCQICGSHPVERGRPWLPDLSDIEIDHIIPVSKGGKDETSNWQVLCKACNRKKGNSVDREMAMRWEAL